jgi:hypothetical protein
MFIKYCIRKLSLKDVGQIIFSAIVIIIKPGLYGVRNAVSMCPKNNYADVVEILGRRLLPNVFGQFLFKGILIHNKIECT